MKRTFLLLTVILVFSITGSAQTPAKPEENARLKPLVDALSKANEPLLAKRNTLPESKAVADAQAALQKATEAQALAVQKLPEFEAVKSAEARLLDEVYKIMADHRLSSREYRPSLNDKGELAFVKIESLPPSPPSGVTISNGREKSKP